MTMAIGLIRKSKDTVRHRIRFQLLNNFVAQLVDLAKSIFCEEKMYSAFCL